MEPILEFTEDEPMRSPRVFYSVLAGVLLPALALAADPTIKDVKIGEILHGPKLGEIDLAGKVVLVELWGIH